MWPLSVLLLAASASAQIPSLGWCPDYQPMANFNMNRFLGNWFEAERFFTVSELGTRCVNTKYEATPEGRIVVSNEITNSLTGMKRVLDGTLQVIGREGEGRLVVKYASLPVPYDNEFSILNTDYDNFAVMWSCSGIGPVHIQNAWILTRDRLATPAVMSDAYAVLERFGITRTFFVKTNQADCNILPQPAADPLPLQKNANSDVVAEIEEQKAEPVANVKNNPVVQGEVPAERSSAPLVFDEEDLSPKIQEPSLKSAESKVEEVKKPMDMKDDQKMPEPEKKEKEKSDKPSS